MRAPAFGERIPQERERHLFENDIENLKLLKCDGLELKTKLEKINEHIEYNCKNYLELSEEIYGFQLSLNEDESDFIEIILLYTDKSF